MSEHLFTRYVMYRMSDHNMAIIGIFPIISETYDHLCHKYKY